MRLVHNTLEKEKPKYAYSWQYLTVSILLVVRSFIDTFDICQLWRDVLKYLFSQFNSLLKAHCLTEAAALGGIAVFRVLYKSFYLI